MVHLFANRWGMVKRAIEKWSPGKLKSEKAYEKSLVTQLKQSLGTGEDVDIIPQYAQGRSKCDIGITVRKFLSPFTRKFYVELKHKLISTSQLQRLKGQIDDYKNADMTPHFIVICGRHEHDLINDLKRYLATISLDGDDFELMVK